MNEIKADLWTALRWQWHAFCSYTSIEYMHLFLPQKQPYISDSIIFLPLFLFWMWAVFMTICSKFPN